MKRKNVKKTTKFQDELVGKDFEVKFEYETINGGVTGSMTATATKAGKTTYVTKSADGNGQSINGHFDAELVTTVIAELEAIVAENTPAVEG